MYLAIFFSVKGQIENISGLGEHAVSVSTMHFRCSRSESSHRRYINEGTWLPFNNRLLIKTGSVQAYFADS